MAPPLKSVVTATPHVSLTLCLSLSPSPSLSLSLSRTNPSSYTHKSDNNKDTRRCCLNPELYYTAWAFASKKEDTEIAEMKLCLLSFFFFRFFFSLWVCAGAQFCSSPSESISSKHRSETVSSHHSGPLYISRQGVSDTAPHLCLDVHSQSLGGDGTPSAPTFAMKFGESFIS